MANEQNLTSLATRSQRERSEIARKGAEKANEVKRAKKNMREMARYLMDSTVNPEMNQVKDTLAKVGVPEDDMTYNAAVVVRLMMNAMNKGDPQSIRVLAELTGDINKLGFGMLPEDTELLEVDYPLIMIPDNGRDQKKMVDLRPQAGPQTLFMASNADIVIYGGAAGGGKTYGLLLEALRHKDNGGFGSVIFRKNFNQITSEGGLWDTSQKIFSQVPDALPRKTPKLHWQFQSGAKVSFAHLEKEENLKSWQGSQICYIGFDELTHFTKHQFLYMLSRNRSDCGIKPYVRATCNPDSDSWVADFISWWIDQDTGYPMPERSGIVRYMCVINDIIYWGDDPKDLAEEHGLDPELCKSVTFIASRLEDNRILMDADPGYLANLMALTEVDMERLLYGNWKIKKMAGSFFKRTQVKNILDAPPDNIVAYCRAWDLAATDKDENDNAAYTAGLLMGVYDNGRFVILDVINKQMKAGEVRDLIKMTAKLDDAKYGHVRVRLPKDPGQAGKEQAESYLKMLAGHDVVAKAETGDKATRAEPMAAQWQHGNFDMMQGEWNDEYLNQLESFPDSKFKDMVDAGSSAFNELSIYAENKVYRGFMGHAEDMVLISDDVARMNMQQVNIGISMKGTGSVSMVATAVTSGHRQAVAVLSRRYIGEMEASSLGAFFLEFCEDVFKKYNRLDFAYTDKKDTFLYRCIKDAAQSNNVPITVRHAANDAESNRIRLVNSLMLQKRLNTTEECNMLMDAMATATLNGNKSGDPRSDQSDISMLNAFDYTIERLASKFITDK